MMIESVKTTSIMILHLAVFKSSRDFVTVRRLTK